MKNTKTKELVETSLLAAICAVMILLYVYVPVFSMLGLYIIPIPITICYVRNGFKSTISAIVVSMILSFLFVNPIQGLTLAVIYGLAGLTLGYCTRKAKDGLFTVFMLTGAFTIGIVVFILVNYVLFSSAGLSTISNQLNSSINSAINSTRDLYIKMGMSRQQIDSVIKATPLSNINYIYSLLPGLLVISSFIMSFINFKITKYVFKKLSYKFNDIPSYSMIYIDGKPGFVIVAVMLIGMILKYKHLSYGDYVLNSASTFFMFTYMIDGISLCLYYLRNKFKQSKPVSALLLFLIVFSGFGMILFFAGIADVLLDFRKIDPNRRKIIT